MTDETTATALKNYTGARAMYSEYMSCAANYASSVAARWPMGEVDIDELVYVRLGGESYDSDHVEPLADFIADLHRHAKGAPEGAELLIKVMSGFGYDDERGDPEYEIGYWREPTAKERAEREERNRKAREHNAALDARKAEKEREEFERLKAKYEPR